MTTIPTPDEVITKELIDKFLTWPLPDSVCSDPCASVQGYPHRSGTNLLSYSEAQQMLEHVVGQTIREVLSARDTWKALALRA